MNLHTLTAAAASFLLAALPFPGSLRAQTLAFYPLATDLLDATANYGPISLLGTTPPAPPNNGVCVNGVYYNSGGQDVRTPVMALLNTADFEFDVDFQLAALPPGNRPVLMGGTSYRWLGIYVQASGIVGLKYNNSNFTWSTTTLVPGIWYSAAVKHENGELQLLLNGTLVHQATVGALVDGNNKNFTTNDFSNGAAFNGCIRNLMIVNDTTLSASAVQFGAGCAGSAGVPTLTPFNTPVLGGLFQLDATNLPSGSGLAFLTIGLNTTTSPLGPLPFNLQTVGLGAGCNLLVSADATVLFPVAGGTGTYPVSITSNPVFAGVRFHFQCATIDSGATGGLAVSNGVRAQLGN